MVQSTANLLPKSSASSYVHLGRWDVLRFTLDDVDALLRAGIVPEDATIELLDGLLVQRDRFDLDERGSAVAGAKHDYVVASLAELMRPIEGATRHVRSQSTLVCDTVYAPVPDAMVLDGSLESYRGQGLPTGGDAYCVVEVADSSYERDTGEKLASYARAGVVQYIVINLRNRTAEIYEQPNVEAGTYPPPTIIPTAGVIPLRVGESEVFALNLADILP